MTAGTDTSASFGPCHSFPPALPAGSLTSRSHAGPGGVDCDVLIVPGADLRMVTYTAATGSSDAGKLDLLRVTAGRRTATALP
ncbi:hypothetical protein [Streptomyces sp. x-19]|uniref:hypothetical protein n=1 Tax=Streptomyces sp. x-19 TaxID=2789280 RepID=UPI00397FE061